MMIYDRIEAVNPNGQLIKTSNSLQSSINKLSNGDSANAAAEDAAELSISEKTKKQGMLLSQSAESAEDRSSLVQVADGAMSEIQDVLDRGLTLSVKAANGTLSDYDKNSLQKEIAKLREKIDGLREQTKFNELYVLQGNAFHNRKYLFLPGRQEAEIELPNISSDSLGISDIDVRSNPEAAVAAFRDARDMVSEERSRLTESLMQNANTKIVDLANQSMLAQANQSNQDVFALIG
jgi:flagellin-like hook-associated protein FlgL